MENSSVLKGDYKILLLIVFLIFCEVFAEEQQKVVTTVVGHIQTEVITSRQVNINFFVESALYGVKGKNQLKEFYPLKSKLFRKEVTAVLLERVVFKDSMSFDSMRVSEKKVRNLKNQFLQKFSTSQLWRDLAVTDQELKSLIRRKLRSKKYIQFKVNSSVIPITQDEARDYFIKNRSKFGNLPFENFQSNIRAFLGRKQIDKRLKNWFNVLQNKYEVKNLLQEVQ